MADARALNINELITANETDTENMEDSVEDVAVDFEKRIDTYLSQKPKDFFAASALIRNRIELYCKYQKGLVSIFLTLSGMTTQSIPSHPQNASSPMVSKPSGRISSEFAD